MTKWCSAASQLKVSYGRFSRVAEGAHHGARRFRLISEWATLFRVSRRPAAQQQIGGQRAYNSFAVGDVGLGLCRDGYRRGGAHGVRTTRLEQPGDRGGRGE